MWAGILLAALGLDSGLPLIPGKRTDKLRHFLYDYERERRDRENTTKANRDKMTNVRS